MPIFVLFGNTSKLALSLSFFEFVINVMQRHLLCFSALCQVGAVGFGGRNVSAVGGWI